METATRSFVDVVGERLTELCAAADVGGSGGAGPASLLAGLLEPWGRAQIGARPAFSSDIGDDSFPVEFSIALDGDSAEDPGAVRGAPRHPLGSARRPAGALGWPGRS